MVALNNSFTNGVVLPVLTWLSDCQTYKLQHGCSEDCRTKETTVEWPMQDHQVLRQHQYGGQLLNF